MAETKGKAVNLRNTVKVKGITHKDAEKKATKQKLTVGKVYDVHPLTAENLVKTGHAEYVDKTAKGK